MSREQLENVKAWEVFCDQLKAAGTVLARETTPADDQTQAEGHGNHRNTNPILCIHGAKITLGKQKPQGQTKSPDT